MKSNRIVAAMLSGVLLFTVSCGSDGQDSGGGGGATKPPAVSDNGSNGGGGGDADNGHELFNASCASCHGQDAQNPPVGKDLAHSDFIRDSSFDDVMNVVLKGRPTSDALNTTGIDMPPKGGNPALSEDDVTDIVAYLKTLNP